MAPEPIRRLAALGAGDVAERLRLSKPQARRLTLLRQMATGTMQAAELGYRHGMTDGAYILLLRAALLETPLAPDMQDDLARGAAARFPVTAADLMPGLSGPALGQRLADLERRWIASGFSLTREDLL